MMQKGCPFNSARSCDIRLCFQLLSQKRPRMPLLEHPGHHAGAERVGSVEDHVFTVGTKPARSGASRFVSTGSCLCLYDKCKRTYHYIHSSWMTLQALLFEDRFFLVSWKPTNINKHQDTSSLVWLGCLCWMRVITPSLTSMISLA